MYFACEYLKCPVAMCHSGSLGKKVEVLKNNIDPRVTLAKYSETFYLLKFSLHSACETKYAFYH